MFSYNDTSFEPTTNEATMAPYTLVKQHVRIFKDDDEYLGDFVELSQTVGEMPRVPNGRELITRYPIEEEVIRAKERERYIVLFIIFDFHLHSFRPLRVTRRYTQIATGSDSSNESMIPICTRLYREITILPSMLATSRPTPLLLLGYFFFSFFIPSLPLFFIL